MKRILGLNKYKQLTKMELYLFNTKREKLISKFCNNVGPESSFQINLYNGIDFIISSFGKDMGDIAELTMSHLHESNKGTTSSVMGYSLLYNFV